MNAARPIFSRDGWRVLANLIAFCLTFIIFDLCSTTKGKGEQTMQENPMFALQYLIAKKARAYTGAQYMQNQVLVLPSYA